MYSLSLLLWVSPFKWKWAGGKVLLVKALLIHTEDKICSLVKRGRTLYKNVVVFLGLFIDWCKRKMDRFYSILQSTGKDDFLANYVSVCLCIPDRYSQNAIKLSLENFQMCQKTPQNPGYPVLPFNFRQIRTAQPWTLKSNCSFPSSWIFYFNSFLVCVLKPESDRQARGKALCPGREDTVQI